MDPADAYVELYDWLASYDHTTLIEWAQEQDVLGTASEVRDEVTTEGALQDRWIPRQRPARRDKIRRCLAVLLGLDRALSFARTESDALPYDELRYLRYRLRVNGRLNQNTGGYLVYRRATACRPTTSPETLADLLTLLRIPSEAGWRVHIQSVTAVDDLPDLENDTGPVGELECMPPIPVAQLPMLAEGEDLIWGTVDRGSSRFYTVAPATNRLQSRLIRALAALDKSKAVLALLPEACIDDRLAKEWQSVLQNNPAPEHSRLTWLLIGTGPLTPSGGVIANRIPNRAVLMTRSGKILLTQDKQRGFTFTGGQQILYGITALDGTTRDEYIHLGNVFNILDSRCGRFAINICEDLDRHDIQHDVITAGVTHLMVPVLAASMYNKGWQASAARSLAVAAGTSVAVTNGLAINRYIPANFGGGPAPTLMVITPPEDYMTDYPILEHMVHLYAGSASATAAIEDALAPRTADW